MTRKQYIASIMLEAADLLKSDVISESAGRNGAHGRYSATLDVRNYEDKIKNLKSELISCENATKRSKIKAELDDAIKAYNVIKSRLRNGDGSSKFYGREVAKSAKDRKFNRIAGGEEAIDDREWLMDKENCKPKNSIHHRINNRASR